MQYKGNEYVWFFRDAQYAKDGCRGEENAPKKGKLLLQWRIYMTIMIL